MSDKQIILTIQTLKINREEAVIYNARQGARKSVEHQGSCGS